VLLAPPLHSADTSWLSLRSALWPDASEREHLREMADVLSRGHFVMLAFGNDGSAIGFVEVSKRNDYVNGTTTSPVGFLESVYVAPSHRIRACAARWFARRPLGSLPKAARNSRPIRWRRISTRMPCIARLDSSKRSVSSIFVGDWITARRQFDTLRRRRGLGGWGGIRTHGGLAPSPDFKSGAFDRSATHPTSSAWKSASAA
jgi:hypothetical protein